VARRWVNFFQEREATWGRHGPVLPTRTQALPEWQPQLRYCPCQCQAPRGRPVGRAFPRASHRQQVAAWSWVAICAALSEMVNTWTSMGVGQWRTFLWCSHVHLWLVRVPSLLRGEPRIAWVWRPCSAPQLGQGWSNGLCPSYVVNGRLCGLRRSPQPLLPCLLPAAIEDTGDTSAQMRRTCGVDV
jgi:hypothetical protein